MLFSVNYTLSGLLRSTKDTEQRGRAVEGKERWCVFGGGCLVSVKACGKNRSTS